MFAEDDRVAADVPALGLGWGEVEVGAEDGIELGMDLPPLGDGDADFAEAVQVRQLGIGPVQVVGPDEGPLEFQAKIRFFSFHKKTYGDLLLLAWMVARGWQEFKDECCYLIGAAGKVESMRVVTGGFRVHGRVTRWLLRGLGSFCQKPELLVGDLLLIPAEMKSWDGAARAIAGVWRADSLRGRFARGAVWSLIGAVVAQG